MVEIHSWDQFCLRRILQQQQQQQQQNKSVDKKHCIINISWLLKGTPIYERLHNTTLTWAAFENSPLIDWPMNFIQGWAEGDLNNKGVVATYISGNFKR